MTSGEVFRYAETFMLPDDSGKTFQASVFFLSDLDGAGWVWGCVSLEL